MIKNLKIKYKLIFFLILNTLLTLAIILYFLNKIFALEEPITKHIPEQVGNIKTTSELDNMAQSIKYYDEVLTQSARNYAFTGDVKWKNRYKDSEPKLDAVIKKAIKKGSKVEKVFFNSVDNVNLALVKLEYQSIELVDNKNKEEAIRILESIEYARLKQEYKHALEEYLNKQGSEYEKSIEAATNDVILHTEEAGEIVNTTLIAVIVFTILVILLAATAGAIMIQYVIKPLARLSKGAKEIGEGNLNYIIDINSNDEIGLLGKAFNEMADSIAKSQTVLETKINERTSELEEVKLGLEETVSKRTAELQQIKNDLENTVAKRTQELTQNLAELEKFQKLIIDRELKMIELKKENERLRATNPEVKLEENEANS